MRDLNDHKEIYSPGCLRKVNSGIVAVSSYRCTFHTEIENPIDRTFGGETEHIIGNNCI